MVKKKSGFTLIELLMVIAIIAFGRSRLPLYRPYNYGQLVEVENGMSTVASGAIGYYHERNLGRVVLQSMKLEFFGISLGLSQGFLRFRYQM